MKNNKIIKKQKIFLFILISLFLILEVFAVYQYSDLGQEFLTNSNIFERTKLWNQLSDADKIEILKQLKEGYKIEASQIGQGKFPNGLKNVRFIKEGIVYEYEGDKKLTTAQGYVDSNNQLTGLKDQTGKELEKSIQLKFGERGEIKINKEGLISYKGKGTGVAFGDKRFASTRYLDENNKDIFKGYVQVLKEDTFKTKGFVSAGDEKNPYLQFSSPVDEIIIDFNDLSDETLKGEGKYLHIGREGGKRILNGDLSNYDIKEQWPIRLKFDENQIKEGEVISPKNIYVTNDNDELLFKADPNGRTWVGRQYGATVCSSSKQISGSSGDCNTNSRVNWNYYRGQYAGKEAQIPQEGCQSGQCVQQGGYQPQGKRYYYNPYTRQMQYSGRCPVGQVISALGTCIATAGGLVHDVVSGAWQGVVEPVWRGVVEPVVKTSLNIGWNGIVKPVFHIFDWGFRSIGRAFSWFFGG
jgi:hypothetical protein